MLQQTTDATALNPAVIERQRQPSRYPRLPRLLNPPETPVLADGLPAVRVMLSGGGAGGAMMLLDRHVWAWVRENYGACWVLNGSGHGHFYVSSTRRALNHLAGQHGAAPKVLLARLIAGKGHIASGMTVRFRNGDPLDLREANLALLPRGEARNWRPDGKPAEITTEPS